MVTMMPAKMAPQRPMIRTQHVHHADHAHAKQRRRHARRIVAVAKQEVEKGRQVIAERPVHHRVVVVVAVGIQVIGVKRVQALVMAHRPRVEHHKSCNGPHHQDRDPDRRLPVEPQERRQRPIQEACSQRILNIRLRVKQPIRPSRQPRSVFDHIRVRSHNLHVHSFASHNFNAVSTTIVTAQSIPSSAYPPPTHFPHNPPPTALSRVACTPSCLPLPVSYGVAHNVTPSTAGTVVHRPVQQPLQLRPRRLPPRLVSPQPRQLLRRQPLDCRHPPPAASAVAPGPSASSTDTSPQPYRPTHGPAPCHKEPRSMAIRLTPTSGGFSCPPPAQGLAPPPTPAAACRAAASQPVGRAIVLPSPPAQAPRTGHCCACC